MGHGEGIEGLVERLTGIHGEGGVCPTAADWRSILDFDPDRPIFVLNLLKFRPEIEEASGTTPGSRAYERYTAGVASAFVRAGAKQIFSGRVGHAFPDGDAWDFAIVSRYPSPRALADMWLDPEFIEAHTHRVDGVDRSQVLVIADAGSLGGARRP